MTRQFVFLAVVANGRRFMGSMPADSHEEAVDMVREFCLLKGLVREDENFVVHVNRTLPSGTSFTELLSDGKVRLTTNELERN